MVQSIDALKKSNCGRGARICFLIMFSISVLLPPAVNGDTIKDVTELIVSERFLSKIGERTAAQEKQSIDWAWVRFFLMHPELAATGQVQMDGLLQTATYDPSAIMVHTLTFDWADPSTGLPGGTGPVIGSVLYEVSEVPDADPALNIFSFLGTSTDSGSNFAFDYTVSGFEPIIRATPFDTLGAPINIVGAGGFNVAIGYGITLAVPVPAAVWLFGSALVGLVSVAKRRKA